MNAIPHFLDGLPETWPDTPCREAPHLFVDASRKTPLKHVVEDAKKVCGRCPVRDACRDYAIANDEQDGVWGGMTPDERAEYARTGPSTTEDTPAC